MIQEIIFIGLVFIGICLIIIYNYIVLWLMPRSTKNREGLSWYSMICTTIAVFCLFLAWRIKEPLAKDFLPVFLIFSLIAGFLSRESANRPYKLAELFRKSNSKTTKAGDKSKK